MLTLKARPRMKLKCPQHPLWQYSHDTGCTPSCETCRAIQRVLEASMALDVAERRASHWIPLGRSSGADFSRVRTDAKS